MTRMAWALILLSLACALPGYALAAWSGVDETVVERFAEEHGRQAVGPIIDTDQGDLLLFLFLLAGAAGGFAAGYYWRTITTGKEKKRGEEG